jgi:hypothetical protein
MAIVGCVLAAGCSSTSTGDGEGAPRAGGGDPSAWGFAYEAPAGWKAQERDPYTLLGSTTESGAIVLGRATFTTDTEAMNALGSVASALALRGGAPIDEPADTTIGGLRAMTATYSAYDSGGSPVRVRYITLFSDYGTSLGIVALTTPPSFDALQRTTDALAATVKASAPKVNAAAIASLTGKWRYLTNAGSSGASHSTDTVLSFDATSFAYSSTSEVFVSTDDAYAYGSAMDAKQTSEHGTYTVIGAEIVAKGKQGTYVLPFTIDSKGLTVGGRTYLRDDG